VKFTGEIIHLKRVKSNEERDLVEDYLRQYFIDAKDVKPFNKYYQEEYLKKIFAEVKLLRNGEVENDILSASEEAVLKDKVEIEFMPQNREFFLPGEGVSLDMRIKNVQNLIVKVFEINTYNYYSTHLENERNLANINLDGLVASNETIFKFEVHCNSISLAEIIHTIL